MDIQYYERLIKRTYNDTVGIFDKGKGLAKFGRNTDLDTGGPEQVWATGGLETLSTTNDITHIASTNAGDTQDVVIEGHTIDGSGDLTFVTQRVTLAGQTKTALSTPLARATRAYNDGATDFAGTVYVAKDVTFTDGVPASGIAITIVGADNQTLKAATSISKNDYWVIVELVFSVERSVTAVVDFKLQVRLKGKTWRTQLPVTVTSNTGTLYMDLSSAPIIVPPNSDVRVIATTDTLNTIVSALMAGPLASVIIDG